MWCSILAMWPAPAAVFGAPAFGPARRITALVGLAALLATQTACEQDEVTERTVAKGIERVPEADAPAEGVAGETTTRPWTVPEGWTEDPEPRPMRLATYLAPDADGRVEVAVTRFGGRVGGELANVNRWRGQMGLEPVDEGDLEARLGRFEAPGFEGYQTRIESPTGVMLAAGVYQASIDQTWFVRATVPDASAADRHQDSVFGLARSIAGLE